MPDRHAFDAKGTLRFDRVEILRHGAPLIALDEKVEPGGVLTVMGPSGSGKSTLLNYAAGFLGSDFTARGSVHIGETEITRLPAYERHVGLLFQDPLLFPHLSVAGNLLFALPSWLKGLMHRRERVEKALEEVGMSGFGPRDPATLSGGQKARVALMRVLLAEPRALLLDEPFSKLDRDLRSQIRELVFAKAKARGLPVLLVTHDHADAEAAGGMVVEVRQAE
ncbi:ATP-binding cassette domain-containing protein [Stappia sp. F7233]|uniref:ATP-binding cassette domain-containing protein n=1 Tax=Stappia albiluteola TaxID=2758565 RepID=A0A839A9H5_9HYPH|nr:ATP-binding cassette domain-containing protein [Stappia albiluteola]MBA5776270.1 ATP-binding cassette domain-containing protein [Stappia albiluteola]